MADSALSRLQKWYADRCDGDWEHSFGIEVGTLDNPGWQVRIDLAGTSADGRDFERVEEHRSDSDWVEFWVAENRFQAAAGPLNLEEALEVFLDWATSA